MSAAWADTKTAARKTGEVIDNMDRAAGILALYGAMKIGEQADKTGRKVVNKTRPVAKAAYERVKPLTAKARDKARSVAKKVRRNKK